MEKINISDILRLVNSDNNITDNDILQKREPTPVLAQALAKSNVNNDIKVNNTEMKQTITSNEIKNNKPEIKEPVLSVSSSENTQNNKDMNNIIKKLINEKRKDKQIEKQENIIVKNNIINILGLSVPIKTLYFIIILVCISIIIYFITCRNKKKDKDNDEE